MAYKAQFLNPKTTSSGTKPTATTDVAAYKAHPEVGGGGVDKAFLAKGGQVPAGYPAVPGGCAPENNPAIKRMAAEKITGNK